MDEQILKKIDHIGIVVKNIESIKNLVELLNLKKIIGGTSCGTKCEFYDAGNTMIEFVEPTSNESIKKFIDKFGEFKIHHMAFKVDNLKNACNYFRNKGQIITFENELSADKKSRVAFLHPKTTGGVLIELVQ